jgi:ribosomal protein S19
MVGHKLGEFTNRSFRGHAGAKIKVKNKKQWEFVKRADARKE